MKSFRFQKFTISQNKNVFRVGTDAVLLGALCMVKKSNKILEVGTGTGIISLMMAQRNSLATILALEINLEAVNLAQENFQNSPFHDRLKVQHNDFNDFKSEEKFDLIISNPPYFEGNSSEKDVIARQQTTLTFENLIKNTATHLSDTGIFSVIIPVGDGYFFESKCEEFGLHLHRKITIFGMKNSKPKRLILEFSFQNIETECKDFIIEKSPRVYSEEYLERTKTFHVFKEKNKI